MPSRIFQRGPTTPQMNITSLIDVVFLLIIFFMLVNNIITEQSVEMIVPKLEDPTTRELDDSGRIIVNIAPAEYAHRERADDPLLFDGEGRQPRRRSRVAKRRGAVLRRGPAHHGRDHQGRDRQGQPGRLYARTQRRDRANRGVSEP
jgi:hypothetical protein